MKSDNDKPGIGPCFRCGQPAQYASFFDAAVGHFVVGGEPRTCDPCNTAIRELPDAERAIVYAGFEVQAEAPNSTGNALRDTYTRGEEFKKRPRSS